MSLASPLIDALQRLVQKHDLSLTESEAAVGCILSGEASESLIAAFLTALRSKGETGEELAGAVAAVRGRMISFSSSVPSETLIDTCGTGGDGANTVNISTAAALVVAACGISVAKHGNRSASGNSGSAEVLAELGIGADADDATLARCLEELGITFLFAPRFHPGLKHAAPVRRQLPFRTIFNLVGPLANPSRPSRQLLGVHAPREAMLVAEALERLGTIRAAVVTGHGGLDEVSLDGPTRVLVIDGGSLSAPISWHPGDFGLGPVSAAELRVTGPLDSASRITRMLEGDSGPVRDMVLANAAAALWVAGETDLEAGVARAAESIDSGRAIRLLERWRKLCPTARGQL